MAPISDPGAGGGEEASFPAAAVGRIPTLYRLSTMMRFKGENGAELQKIDVTKLSLETRHNFIERILRVTDEDHERFLRKLRERLDRYFALYFTS